VLEAKPAGTDKGTAIADFMLEAPFQGRRPVFAGDDATDEDAFAMVNAIGGITIKIGIGPTGAHWRTPGTATFLHWLGETAARLGKETASD
jgi:trehalose 6-phosphate phosphatase